jgi:hypothetical protein
VQVPQAYGLVMCPRVVLALVISKTYLPGVLFYIICILGNFITYPEIPHFYRLQVLSFDSIVCNTNIGCIVAMNYCFRLRVS